MLKTLNSLHKFRFYVFGRVYRNWQVIQKYATVVDCHVNYACGFSVKSLPMIMYIYLYICTHIHISVCFIYKYIWFSNCACIPLGMPYTVNKTVKCLFTVRPHKNNQSINTWCSFFTYIQLLHKMKVSLLLFQTYRPPILWVRTTVFFSVFCVCTFIFVFVCGYRNDIYKHPKHDFLLVLSTGWIRR